MSKALVVLSGGQDSATCLGLALKQCNEVQAISFVYGQRHSVEVVYATEICAELGVSQKIVCLDFMGDLVTSALLEAASPVDLKHCIKKALPASYVPNRNALFFILAHAYAQEINAGYIYTGVCETDYSGYPDCREYFISTLQYALNVGYETNISFVTPLMRLTKAETFKLAADCGFLDIVLEKTITCYNGVIGQVNEWGRGCGECLACKLRAKGWEEYKMSELSAAGKRGSKAGALLKNTLLNEKETK